MLSTVMAGGIDGQSRKEVGLKGAGSEYSDDTEFSYRSAWLLTQRDQLLIF